MASDEDVAERLNDFMIATLDHAMYLLNNSAPEYQIQLIKSALPALTRTLVVDAEAESITQLRARQETMFADIRTALTPPERPVLEAIIIPDDTPPVPKVPKPPRKKAAQDK